MIVNLDTCAIMTFICLQLAIHISGTWSSWSLQKSIGWCLPLLCTECCYRGTWVELVLLIFTPESVAVFLDSG